MRIGRPDPLRTQAWHDRQTRDSKPGKESVSFAIHLDLELAAIFEFTFLFLKYYRSYRVEPEYNLHLVLNSQFPV